MSSEVPEGWASARLAEVVRIVTDGVTVEDLAKMPEVYHYSLPAFDAWGQPEIGPGASIKSNKTIVPPDCVLFSKLNPRIPRIWRVRKSASAHSYCSTEFWPLVRQTDQIDLDFLAHLVGSERFLGDPAISPSSSTNSHQRVDRKSFEGFRLLLPPLDEQRRIAEVLRSLDDTALTSNRTTVQFSSVIQKAIDAVVGGLFSDESIPKERLGDIASVKGGKRLPKGSEYEEAATANRYVRVTDWQDHRISPDHIRWISDDVAAAIRRYTISSDDIFISIAGSIGLVAEVPVELDGSFLTENAAKIVLRDPRAIDAGYLLVALRSDLLSEQIRQQKGVGGGVPKLALFRIEDLVAPVPPIHIQREIAEAYRGLMAAKSLSSDGSLAAVRLKASVSSDLLSGRVRVPV